MLARSSAPEEGAREQLRRLYFAYVNLLEIGRDRIVSAGGTCDPVDVMEAGDPALMRVRKFFAERGEEAGLTVVEMKAQGARCGCGGADDYCPCHNAPDATTRRERAGEATP